MNDKTNTQPPLQISVGATTATSIVEALFEDLRGRRFLKWLFDRRGSENMIARFQDGEELRGLDLEVQEDIKAAWRDIIAAAPAGLSVGSELPRDIIESLLAIGPVEWGVSLTQPDEKHASDLLDTLRITREHFGVTEEQTIIHGVYLEGTGTVLAHTGMSPNSPQHARILVGAWNQLVEIAKALEAGRKVVRHG